MRAMTIKELLMKEDDKTLLDIYDELASGVMPATGYAHEYIRKVNRMINEGKLCGAPSKYRTVYLPTVSKAIYVEMARRYALHCYTTKTAVPKAIFVKPIERNDHEAEEPHTCDWCGIDDFEPDELRTTDLGMLCDRCIQGIRSRGDIVVVLD